MISRHTAALLLVLFPTLIFSQISVAAKSHLLFPSKSGKWSDITDAANNAYSSAGKTQIGLNAGLSLKIELMKMLFIMPESYYTIHEDSFTDPISNTTLEARTERIDVPVLVGINIIGEYFTAFAGPVGSYILAKDNKFEDFNEKSGTNYTIGFQAGAQIKIKKIILSGRYEGAVKNSHRYFINEISDRTIRYDNRQNLFMAGLGIAF